MFDARARTRARTRYIGPLKTRLRYRAGASQRRLASRGVTHSKLVDDVRRELALKYIGHAGLSILDIAYLLHLSDATSFLRAFKRWTSPPARISSRTKRR